MISLIIRHPQTEEEVKHYQKVKELAEHKTTDLPDSQILLNVVTIFTDIKNEGGKIDLTGLDQISIYKKAQDFEKKSEEFYLEKSNSSTDPEEKRILKLLSEQERKHYILLQNIVEFVSRPEQWVEDAEFGKMANY